MKLPDFRNAVELNQLRKRMDAELIDLSVITWNSLNEDDLLSRLKSIEGIIVDDISEISFADDGTFEYKGQKVLVYIRDQKYNPRYVNRGEYKFHICNCETIDRYIRNNRFDRYVVSTRTDGKFLVNVVNVFNNEYIEEGIIKELKVCKNCLLTLSYKGYTNHSRGTNIYNSFKLSEFFEMFSTKFTQVPRHNENTAPPDLYTNESRNFNERIKSSKNWCCENCGIDLSENKRFLNIHHINGVKSDNRLENLKCLCIKCHSDQPDHFHLKWSHDFFDFNELFGDKRN